MSGMKPRILMALPQMPQDPASGAARTAQTALEMAADAGFEVRAVATTATERGSKTDPHAYLKSIGLEVEVKLPSSSNRREFRFVQRSIPYELESFEPDILFTYGGLPGNLRRHRRTRLRGCRIAFCLFNFGYFSKEFFDPIELRPDPQ
jgi:hypothetical protein